MASQEVVPSEITNNTTAKKKIVNKPKTCTVTDLQQVIKETIPPVPKGGPKKIAPASVGGQPTPWAFVRTAATPDFMNSYDEVYPGIFLGDQSIATDKEQLQKLAITHLLNTAEGKKFHQVNTSEAYYRDVGIIYHGVPAMDIMTFPLHKYFRAAAQFIQTCLDSEGKVYVHCVQGLSRSASTVIAYLMLHQKMSVIEATKHVRKTRAVHPNEGFLKQLCFLNDELYPESVKLVDGDV